ncbi:unnamed protein product [Brassica oleracea var. botrytis]
MISDQATTIHVDSQETKNKVKLGLVDWFVDQPFSSKSFSSFNPLEKGFSRYHVRLIPTAQVSHYLSGTETRMNSGAKVLRYLEDVKAPK